MFASAASCYHHMKHFHDALTAREYGVQFKKIQLTSTHEHINKTDKKACERVCIEDCFIEFEKKLPFEFKYNICTCTLCGKIFENIQDYLNHEIIHYQVMEMKMQVQVPVQVQVSMPVQIKVPMPMSGPMPVQVKVPMPISDPVKVPMSGPMPIQVKVPMPVQVKVPKDESTSSTDNNNVCDKIICNICKCIFTTNLDFEEHKNINCKRVEQKTPIGDTANIKKEPKLLYNPSDLVIVEKSTSLNLHSQDHINACKELYMDKQQFYCDICQETCERSDHFEINQWWSPSSNYYRPFKCLFCSEKFSEKAALKLHETVHFNKKCC